jgi:hypothetical protein
VEVLTRGTGGAGEARAAVAQYEEKSPLYGFMLYRRRKVLVKYVPDGTSRLLQGMLGAQLTGQAAANMPSPRRRSFHRRDGKICATRLRPKHIHSRRAERCRPYSRLHTAHRRTLQLVLVRVVSGAETELDPRGRRGRQSAWRR